MCSGGADKLAPPWASSGLGTGAAQANIVVSAEKKGYPALPNLNLFSLIFSQPCGPLFFLETIPIAQQILQ